MTHANRDLALHYLDCQFRLDFDASFAFLSESLVVVMPDGRQVGKAELRRLLDAGSQTVAGEIAAKFVGTIADDNRVAVEIIASAQLKDGSSFNNRYLFAFTIVDSKIVHISEYYNQISQS